jgi:hypothetical protein
LDVVPAVIGDVDETVPEKEVMVSLSHCSVPVDPPRGFVILQVAPLSSQYAVPLVVPNDGV